MNSSFKIMYLVFSNRDVIAQAAFTYCFGYVCGFSTAAILVMYFLSEARVTSSGSNETSQQRRRNVLKEDLPNDESRKILDDAVRHLVNIQAGRIDIQLNEDEVHHEIPNMSLYQLEQHFQESCNTSRERAKHLKSLASFITDISKTYASFGKDLSKLSLIARSCIKPHEITPGDHHTDNKVDSIDKISHVNEWWIALSISLEHLSSDNEKLSEQMSQEVASQITQAYDEQNVEDKLLYNEGLRLLTQLKESLMSNEPLVQERDKWRVKVSSALHVPASIPVIGGMTLTQSEEENNRRVLKLQTCELALLDSTKRVHECKNEFKSLMPKIFSSFRATGALSFIRVKMQLMNFGGLIGQQGDSAKSITDRFKEHISTMYSSSIAAKGIKKFAMMGFEPMLQSTLTALSKEWMKRKYFSNDCRRSSSSSSLKDSSLNMSLESTACLAACPPTSLPALPTCIRKSVGQETCVWFNAFSGRVYRDIARSEYFRDWLLEKLTTELNKGVKPGFVDDFVVESVAFGSTPPLLLNILWSAPVVSPNGNDEKDKDDMGRKGAKDYVEINKNYSSESHSDLGSPTYSTENESNSGNQGGKVKKDCIASPGSSCRRNSNEFDHRTHSDNSSGADQGSRSDEDIECTADVAFRSGLKFKASTRLWCNWPMDRCASIPVSLTLELVEFSGRIRFGVCHSCSFISFLEVQSELGGDSFKFKDIPKLSKFIIKKLKGEIVKKMVYPNVHRFRLPWPRNWWPDDAKGDFFPPECAAPTTLGGGAVGVISHSGDVSVRAAIFTTSAMRAAGAGGTAGTDALSSRNSLDGVPSTGTGTTNVSEISLPALDHEDRVRSAQSAASAVLASFSSTSDWIRSEVRSFKIIPGPFQPSTPPVHIAEGIESMEGVRPWAKHEKPVEGDKHLPEKGHGKSTPLDVLSGAAHRSDHSDTILPNVLSFPFSQSSFKLKMNGTNTERAHSPWEINSTDTSDSTPGIIGTAPLSDMEIKTIIECEKMNYLTSQTLLDREKDQEREHLEKLESENISKNWMDKLNGATEILQNKFSEIKNKVSHDPNSTPPARSRSTSEAHTLPLSLSTVLADMLTSSSTKKRRDSLTSQSLSHDEVSDATKKDISCPDRTSHNNDNTGGAELKSNSSRSAVPHEEDSEGAAHSVQDNYGIADSGAVCVDKRGGSVISIDSVADGESDWSVGNADQDQYSDQDQREDSMVDSIRDTAQVKKMNVPCKSGFKESCEGDMKDVNFKVAIPLARFKYIPRPEEVRFDEYCRYQKQKSDAASIGSDSILLRKEYEVPVSPLLCSLSMSPPYSPNREKGYLVPEPAATPNKISSGISIENLQSSTDKKTGKFVKNNGTSDSIEFSSIDVDKFHRDFEEKYRRQTESLVSNREMDDGECDDDEDCSIPGFKSSAFPVCVGLLKATTAFPNEKEMWGELCHSDDGTATLKLYRVLNANEKVSSVDDSKPLAGFGSSSSSPSLALVASYSVTRCRPFLATTTGGSRSGSIEIIDESSYDNQEDLLVGDKKAGIASILKAGRVRDENSIVLNQSEAVSGAFSVKMTDSPTVAACDEDSEIDKRNPRRTGNGAPTPPHGFEILLPITASRERNVSFDLSGTRSKLESSSMKDRGTSEKGAMKGAQRAVGTVTWASVGNVSERDREISKSLEKEKWLTFFCFSESECAGWISSLQMTSKR